MRGMGGCRSQVRVCWGPSSLMIRHSLPRPCAGRTAGGLARRGRHRQVPELQPGHSRPFQARADQGP